MPTTELPLPTAKANRRLHKISGRGLGYVWVGIALIATLTGLVTQTGSSYELYVLNSILLACLGAVALQVLQGTSGLVSVGGAAFLMWGAYGAVFVQRSGVPFPLDVIVGAAFAAIAGLIGGMPALRLRSLYLALATLAVHFITVFLANTYQNSVPTAQAAGFSTATLFGSNANGGVYWAWLLVACVAVVLIGARRIMRERSGRALRMIRDHEVICPAFGISVVRYKLKIFVLTSAIFGVEGGLLLHFTGNVVTDDFPLTLAFQYVAMIIIGGEDSLAGAVIGAVVVVGVPAYVPQWLGAIFGQQAQGTVGSNVATIIYGLLVVAFVISGREGIVGHLGALRGAAARWSTRRTAAATDRPDEPGETSLLIDEEAETGGRL